MTDITIKCEDIKDISNSTRVSFDVEEIYSNPDKYYLEKKNTVVEFVKSHPTEFEQGEKLLYVGGAIRDDRDEDAYKRNYMLFVNQPNQSIVLSSDDYTRLCSNKYYARQLNQNFHNVVDINYLYMKPILVNVYPLIMICILVSILLGAFYLIKKVILKILNVIKFIFYIFKKK